MAKKKLRPLGNILLDMEVLRMELLDHGWQWGDFLYEDYGWLRVHAPGAQEEYTEKKGPKHPEFYYGYPRRTK